MYSYKDIDKLNRHLDNQLESFKSHINELKKEIKEDVDKLSKLVWQKVVLIKWKDRVVDILNDLEIYIRDWENWPYHDTYYKVWKYSYETYDVQIYSIDEYKKMISEEIDKL